MELPLLLLADALLAAIAMLLVALPPAITLFLPQYTGTIAPLRVMLVGTYFLCLAPPAGQLLLTIHKQVASLLLTLPPTALALEASFDGGRLTSDGGLPWLSEAEETLGICAAFAACVPEWRGKRVQHSLETLVRQRVFQIACGYEDQNDADTLRTLYTSGADALTDEQRDRLVANHQWFGQLAISRGLPPSDARRPRSTTALPSSPSTSRQPT